VTATADIGVFGGSGFSEFLDNAEQIDIDTPYGKPSGPVAVGELAGRRVAFMPRHGVGHIYPAHTVNYRANVWAMKELGVGRLFGPCAVGSLQPWIKPGDLVVCDQMVDRTHGRASTFYDGPETTHVSFADPYCEVMRSTIIERAEELELTVHTSGTVVVIPGPRFSTRAESHWYTSQGWEVVNMTQAPEAALARELEICYANISLITDYDAGVEEVEAVTAEEVMRVFADNNARLRELLFAAIPALPAERDCPCATALESARF
jgi:5'-methylthioadenosine phosphorylase